MVDDLTFTPHARDRATARAIPEGIVSLILDHGDPLRSRDAALRFALSGDSLRRIKRLYGPEVAKALAAYRTAYVVVCETTMRVITVAHARRPLVH